MASNNSFSDDFAGSFSDLLMNGNSMNHHVGLSFNFPEEDGRSSEKAENSAGAGAGARYRHTRPGRLDLPANQSPFAPISPGFSPSILLNSPTFFPTMNPYGLSPLQAIAQAQAQAQAQLSHSHSHLGIQHHEFQTPPMFLSAMTYQTPHNTQLRISEPSSGPHLERVRPPQSFPAPVDKPVDDGFNWRKYGQKQVKGSEYPRSYYRCTTQNCPVKKKVERSFDGHITEIIYKGQHSHERPKSVKKGQSDNGGSSQGLMGNLHWSGQATSMQLNGPSDSEESGENSEQFDGDDYGDRLNDNGKRPSGEGPSGGLITHRTRTEPKIVVQTRSDVDLLDDGYRWRKYGQKVVKGNPNPRSYYKCTTTGCTVRKHVERASTDSKAVITTYEGKHDHDVPAARGGNANTTVNVNAQNHRLHNSNQMNFGNNGQTPASLRLKEEQS